MTEEVQISQLDVPIFWLGALLTTHKIIEDIDAIVGSESIVYSVNIDSEAPAGNYTLETKVMGKQGNSLTETKLGCVKTDFTLSW